jgi:hypothetical protein
VSERADPIPYLGDNGPDDTVWRCPVSERLCRNLMCAEHGCTELEDEADA